MPGLTTTAVVLLWVMVVLSTIGVLIMILTLVSPVISGAVFDMLGPQGAMLLPIIASQALAWAIVRAVLAVKIARRSAWARNAAFVFEAIGLAFQFVFAYLLFSAVVSTSPDNYRLNFDCTGIVLPILVICFLASARVRPLNPCNRRSPLGARS